MKIISRERYYIEGKKILTWPTKFKNHKTWDCVNKLSHIHMHKKNTNKLYLRFSKSYLAFFIFTLGTRKTFQNSYYWQINYGKS